MVAFCLVAQVSRSIGDVYLKKPEFNKEPLFQRFRLPEPLKKPVLSAEPVISTTAIRAQDRFVIFASDGLWEHLSNQEAVEIVHNHPRSVSHVQIVDFICALFHSSRSIDGGQCMCSQKSIFWFHL